ncbi:MAG: RIP metalloprotease RseP [Betaproteobacteria bacterium]|nr:RIP metalloprotease RseP [Betaproteobacteria bacterium]
MNLLITVVAFAIALGVLIVIHELGHYIVARFCGVKVLRFSVGFGKPVYSRPVGADRTEWVIAAIPLGGYVKMLDEREGRVAPEELGRAFNRQSVWRRFVIVLAGPAANFLLAVLLYWFLFLYGVQGMRPVLGPVPPETHAAAAAFRTGETIVKVGDEPVQTWQEVRWALLKQAVARASVNIEVRGRGGEIDWRRLDLSVLSPEDLDSDFLRKLGLLSYQPTVKAVVGRVVAASPAARAGLREGDEIIEVNGLPVARWEDLVKEVRALGARPANLLVSRDGARVAVQVIPDMVVESGTRVGKIGIAPRIDRAELQRLLVQVRYPPDRALLKALGKTWETSVFSLQMLWKMIVGEVSWRNVSGPITIADYAGQSAQMGLAAYVGFLALISISLGVLNLLPIPLLDGGHLMYYMAEIIRGRPPSERAMEIGQQVGIALLITLMAFALYNDINRLISG